ncbi:MAG: FitA-like ribbon-helix-helix domain-containing protein [Pseudomonadota bacterium]
MATITIRNLPYDLMERIEERAEANSQSVEDEVRAQLEQCYGPVTDKQECPDSKATTLVEESRQAAALDANSALNVAVEEIRWHRH